MLRYVQGDATDPQPRPDESGILIPHIVNDSGGWGRGFVVALSKRWPEPEDRYRFDYKQGTLQLGNVSYALVRGDLIVANMCAQHGFGAEMEHIERFGLEDSMPRQPIRYGALTACMKDVAKFALAGLPKLAIHTPMFGAGLAGGHATIIEQMILEHWVDNGISVTIYLLD